MIYVSISMSMCFFRMMEKILGMLSGFLGMLSGFLGMLFGYTLSLNGAKMGLFGSKMMFFDSKSYIEPMKTISLPRIQQLKSLSEFTRPKFSKYLKILWGGGVERRLVTLVPHTHTKSKKFRNRQKSLKLFLK